jgi:hypothetical protein
MKLSIIANPGTVFVPGRAPIVLAPPPPPPVAPVALAAYENPPVRAVRPEAAIVASVGTVAVPGREPMVLEKPRFELPLAVPLAAAPVAVAVPPSGVPALSVGIIGAPNTTVSNTPANLYVNPLTNITEFIVVELDAGTW